MAQKAISWVLVGVFTYLWWWIGFDWSYLDIEGADWSDVYVLFTLISLVLINRARTSS